MKNVKTFRDPYNKALFRPRSIYASQQNSNSSRDPIPLRLNFSRHETSIRSFENWHDHRKNLIYRCFISDSKSP